MTNTNTETETNFFRAYNEVRFSARVVALRASKGDDTGALEAALYGTRQAMEAMRLGREIMPVTELVTYTREMRAIQNANRAATA